MANIVNPQSPSRAFDNPQLRSSQQKPKHRNATMIAETHRMLKVMMVLAVLFSHVYWSSRTFTIDCDSTEEEWNDRKTVASPHTEHEPAPLLKESNKMPTLRGQVPPNYDGPQRIFLPWNYSNHPFPCFPAEAEWDKPSVARSPTRTGLLFLRNMKTGSSTLGGVTIRIARNMARRAASSFPMCKVRFDHTPASILQYGKRDKEKSYLFSFLREPTERAVSEFFHFGVSRLKFEPSAANFKAYLMSREFLNNYFLWDMSLGKFQGGNATWEDKQKAVDEILVGYDFIGITERMDESLVVLKMLLNLEFNDILHLSAKGNGGFDDGAIGGKCHYIVPQYVPPLMQTFFNGPEWAERVNGDTLLYHAAIRSLDLTIEALGSEEVHRQLVEYRRLQAVAKETCLPTTVPPCTSDGVFHRTTHNCLFWDSGCGYECLDKLRDIEPAGFPNPPHIGQGKEKLNEPMKRISET